MGSDFLSQSGVIFLILILALGAFLLCALSPYEKVARLIGRPWLAALVGLMALFALILHIAPHFQELVQDNFSDPTLGSYLLVLLPFFFIAALGFWVENLYHSHEHEHEHAAHTPETGFAGKFSSVTRLFVLALHAFLDGHVMASLGLSWLILPFVFHKGVDGLVVNGERTTHRDTAAWRWRVAIQLSATTIGAMLRLENIPELIHVGLVAAVVGLYTAALANYVSQRSTVQKGPLEPDSVQELA